MGVLKWVDWTVSEPRYFQLQTDHTPIHLALLDEVCPRHIADNHNGGGFFLNINPAATQICTCHQLLHPQVLHLLIKLFETEHSQLDVMEQVGFLSSSSLSATRRLTLGWFSRPPLDGAEEDSAGPHGSPSEPWIRVACCRLHSQMSGEAQHRYLPHPILCHRGNGCSWCEALRNRSWATLDAAGCVNGAANPSGSVFPGAGCDRSSLHLRLCSALLAHPGEWQHRRNDPHRGRTRPSGRVHRCVSWNSYGSR